MGKFSDHKSQIQCGRAVRLLVSMLAQLFLGRSVDRAWPASCQLAFLVCYALFHTLDSVPLGSFSLIGPHSLGETTSHPI